VVGSDEDDAGTAIMAACIVGLRSKSEVGKRWGAV